MKKVLSLIAALGMVLAATTAMAAVSGSPHEYGSGAAYGMCEVCHVPHAATPGAKRLWQSSPLAIAGVWTGTNVGKLCGTCHYSTGLLNAVPNRYNSTPSDQDALAFSATAHGRAWNELTVGGVNPLGDTAAELTGKPYVAATNAADPGFIECTSCHNPHDHAVRPFLRDNGGAGAGTISGFCADCHSNRYDAGVTDPVTVNVATDQMHPINISYSDAALNGGTYFQAVPGVGTTLVLAKTAGAVTSTWPLTGTKMEGAVTVDPGNWVGAANIGCATCHSIHNSVAQTSGDTALHLLAADNSAASAGLCESCHGGPAAGGTSVGTVVGDHPIDKAINFLDGGPSIGLWFNSAGSTTRDERTTAVDKSWPRGSTGNIICTSCHSAHKSATAQFGRLTRDNYTATSFCSACHADASPAAHHSHDGNTGGVYSATASAVTCSACHGVGLTGAHNGFSFKFTDAVNQLSQLCEGCHTAGDPAGPGVALENAGGINAITSADHLLPEVAGTTHYTGVFATAGANAINVKRGVWAVGKAKYGSTRSTTQVDPLVDRGYGDPASLDDPGNRLICESCHSVLWNMGKLDPPATVTTAGWRNNLLLMDYRDDSSGVGTGIGSAFCMGCHRTAALAGAAMPTDAEVQNNALTPPNMHPMTNWVITKALDTGRARTTLATTVADGSYADTVAAGIGATGGSKTVGARSVSYPAVNAMDCDSCHRPHRADNTGNGLYNETQTQPGVDISVILEKSGPAAYEFDSLCLECHTY